MKIAALVADAFQDSEYFLPKAEIERMGMAVEVISLRVQPVEIYSFFNRIGLLDVQRAIAEADPQDYAGVLIPGGARSPALLAQSEAVLAFVRQINEHRRLVAPICRGSLLAARAGVVAGRRITGFHLGDQYPDLVVRPMVEQAGGLWQQDQPVVVDGNLISSRHPDDVPQFAAAIRHWFANRGSVGPTGPSELTSL